MPIAANIYYHLYEGGAEGEKPPVVLIHGAGGNHLYWPFEMRRLPAYRVYAVDLPGHGKSGGRGQQSITGYASALREWLIEVGIHSAVWIGHSMGSAIAITLALQAPEQVLGLGLIGGDANLRVNPALLESTASPTTFYNAVETIIRWSFSPETPASLTEIAARRMSEIRPSVLHGDLLACQDFDETERISQVQQPALVLTGAEDKMTPVRAAQFLADSLPKGQLEIVPGAGHMVMLEKPQVVAAAVLRFLEMVSYS